MKRLLIICSFLISLCLYAQENISQPENIETSTATVRFMIPLTKSQARMFGNDYIPFYIEVNGKCIGEFTFRQYIDIIVPPGLYTFNLYNGLHRVTAFPIIPCTYEIAKEKGTSIVYENIDVQAGKIYYIDVTKLKRVLSDVSTFNKALNNGKIVKVDNMAQKRSSQKYEVQEGDNLAKIAQMYHVSVSEIAKENNIKPSTILTIGQTLTLPQGAYLFQKNQVLSSMPAKSAMSVNSNPSKESIVSNKLTSVVDKEIPSTNNKSTNTYVLIIANEDYEFLSDVDYAVNDGKIFKEYCVKTLGVPEKQIFYFENATLGKITYGVERLSYCLNNFAGAKAIVYYCGHGIPDEKTSQAYLIPVDGMATNTSICYNLNTLYKTLSATKAQSITYFMDACFTGANKEGSMLVAARGVARAPKKETLAGNTIVFSASSGDETAMTLNEEGHGLFTYYLLKKLQETEGNVTYGDLAEYINKNVKKDAFLINEKPQTPVVATSPAVVNTWKTMKLK